MGGRTFASRLQPLNVVRLSPAHYAQLRDACEQLLLKFFERVCTPPEAPQKPDHGDIDILVDKPLRDFTCERLTQALGAEDRLRTGGVTSFAIPVPERTNELFQLDVHVCKPNLIDWEATIYSYGDVWHILGQATNRLGFAINDTGFHLRVPEIEKTHPKDCLLHLTNDPTEAMRFLGLDHERFVKAFLTIDEVFAWATSSRFFDRYVFEKQKGKLLSKKKAERPMYINFVEHWLPQNPDVGVRDPDKDETRTRLTEEALVTFDKRDDLTSMLERHKRRLMKDAMWSQIARSLPLDGKELGKAMVALKTYMTWRDDALTLVADAKSSQFKDGSVERVPALDQETVGDVVVPWVLENWQEAVAFAESTQD